MHKIQSVKLLCYATKCVGLVLKNISTSERLYIYRKTDAFLSVGAYFCRVSCCDVLSDSRSKLSRSKQTKIVTTHNLADNNKKK